MRTFWDDEAVGLAVILVFADFFRPGRSPVNEGQVLVDAVHDLAPAVSFRPKRMSPSFFSLAAWMAAVSPEMTLLSSMLMVKPASFASFTSHVVRSVELELE